MKRFFFLGLMIIMSFLFAGCHEAVTLVNGQEITKEELSDRLEILKKFYTLKYKVDFSKSGGKVTEEKLEKAVLEQIVMETLLQQEAKRRNIAVSAAEVNQAIQDWKNTKFASPDEAEKFLRDNEIEPAELKREKQYELLLGKLKQDVLSSEASEVTEDECRAYFAQHKSRYGYPEIVRARHIVVKDRLKAEQLLAKLNSGVDFAELAREFSEDKASAVKGGDLGYFSKGQMVPPFEKAAFSLEKDKISSIIQTEYGYHIIKVLDHKPAEELEYSDVREEVKQLLGQQKQQKAWEKFKHDLQDRAIISVYE